MADNVEKATRGGRYRLAAVPNDASCKNTSYSPGIYMHQFPVNVETRQKWARLVQRHRNDFKDFRRDTHKLCLLYKMVFHPVPNYLWSLLPSRVNSRTTYLLRNATDYSLLPCKTNRYLNSFLPSSVKLWNQTPETIRQSKSFEIFKCKLIHFVRPSPPKFFNICQRYPPTLLTRMRLGFCALNHFCIARKIVDSPKCSCSSPCENIFHYFIHYPLPLILESGSMLSSQLFSKTNALSTI